MAEANIDPVSGIHKDVLSEIVYSFFPTSSRNLDCLKINRKNPPFIKQLEGDVEYIDCGSRIENLTMPPLFDRNEKKPTLIVSDDDRMMSYFNHVYRNFSLEIDEQQPVFCRIQHGIQDIRYQPVLLKLEKGQYLSSAAVKENLETRFIKTNSDGKLKIVNFTFQKDYDSSSIASSVNGFNISWSNDMVFCVRVKLEKKMEFVDMFLKRLKRNKWPLNSVPHLPELFTERVYAIPKPDPGSKMGDLRWRLSFSVIEVELAHSLTDIQRRCYWVLKAIIKFNINENLPEGTEKYPSYYLKTLMFWSCEKASEDGWTFQNIGKQWLRLIDSVIDSLENEKLPHYFVPSYNLMENKPSSVINCWKERFQQVRMRPLEAFTKIWSDYEIKLHYGVLSWGKLFHRRLEAQLQTYENLATSFQLFLAKYLLCVNCLTDMLKYLSLQPNLNKVIDVSHAQSQEHVIWIYYTVLWQEMLLLITEEGKSRIHLSKRLSSLWTSIAEVTHHMVEKYRGLVPDKDLFSKRTAEQFHLIACSLGKEGTTYINAVRYIKYANFLRVDKQYQEAVIILLKYCQTYKPYDDCYINRVTLEVLDVCLKLELAFLGEIRHSQTYFVYHLLTCCYTEARVLAEVYSIPCNLASFTMALMFQDPQESFYVLNKLTLGFQLILSGNLEEAFKCIASVLEEEMETDDEMPDNIQYTAMLYLLARSYMLSFTIA